jgi:predicted RNA-binding Zn-ribbon protein involved in translation (DUF1610 family)
MTDRPIQRVAGTGFPITSSEMPRHLTAQESDLYRKLHHLNCSHSEKKSDFHDCRGRITITQNGITLNCPLCGDSRSTHSQEQA